MSTVKLEVNVAWASDYLTVEGNTFDGEFEFECAYFPNSVYIDIDKLSIPMADFIMSSVYKQLENRDERD